MNQLVDARGQKCPLPALRAEKAAAGLKPGDILTVLATDPMARVDIPHFCARTGLTCTEARDGEILSFEISVRAETPS